MHGRPQIVFLVEPAARISETSSAIPRQCGGGLPLPQQGADIVRRQSTQPEPENAIAPGHARRSSAVLLDNSARRCHV